MSTAVRERQKPFIHVRYSCLICPCDHAYVCNCGHRHDEHMQSSGCQVEGCQCTQYDQTRQRMVGESQEMFDKRTLSKRSH